jgi:hypothetical protein
MAKVKMRIESYAEVETKLAGVTHTDPVSGIDRQILIKAHLRPGMVLELRREPDNEYDRNAIGVRLRKRIGLRNRDLHLGYIKASEAQYLAPRMDAGQVVTATVLAITGNTKDRPTCGVKLQIRY